jgi:hypothetical protein
MSVGTDTANAALTEVDRLRTFLKKNRTAQVRGQDERSFVKATASAWFNGHRGKFPATASGESIERVDAIYRDILNASDRAAARSTSVGRLKELRAALIDLRSASLTETATPPPTDQSPDFSPLISDTQMQEILAARWAECIRCIAANAPLAATVMMGGLLETLLLGRINRETDLAPIFKAKMAPKDKAGKTLTLRDWGLKDYISVAHELGWITISAKEVAEVLRDFRNYIHPHKQHSHGVKLNGDDATLFWGVSKNITVQVLKSCTP